MGKYSNAAASNYDLEKSLTDIEAEAEATSGDTGAAGDTGADSTVAGDTGAGDTGVGDTGITGDTGVQGDTGA